jgi:pyruvate/2-oxoglutarate/acetoin dehydrogenase E1 component/TPP-dependent pyruvate/acetoin dehydrogenase alpha subunit
MSDARQRAALSLPEHFTRESILRDYRVGVRSREASLLGRREVLTGKAKFGIFGDGKEVAQLAMARAFRPGDWRSGYYRDQTFLLAVGALTLEEFFAQLYADAEKDRDPGSGGRQMNAHFATRLLDESGDWYDQLERFNSSADVSPTGSQMPRLVGLAWASKLYRDLGEAVDSSGFSSNGEEIAFGTIGNASCAEGLFWESVNAIGVLRAPALISIWDDGYGISVPNEYQVTKQNLSEVLRGFQRLAGGGEGYDIYTVRGWDYASLCEIYLRAAETVRRHHVPAILHITEMTQPQGHSTSGSHERYKSRERLTWELEFDCLAQMRQWMVEHDLAAEDELEALEQEETAMVRSIRERTFERFRESLDVERNEALGLLSELGAESASGDEVAQVVGRLERNRAAMRRDVHVAVLEALVVTRGESGEARDALVAWRGAHRQLNRDRFGSHLLNESGRSALDVSPVAPKYSDASPQVNGFEILNRFFDAALAREPRLIAFGEDVGRLGDVNQGFSGLQEKYGRERVTDTGIREATILGQAIGLALRGLRPLAEIQYLDYLLYALQIMSDDLATLHWRTKGRQKAPVLIRTRGHRLEGIWHAGSPMGGIVHMLRGIHVCVPRNMTQAAGMYNTLLEGDDPGLVVEVLNGYRVKETMPDNLAEVRIPLGVPEVLREGSDVTVVTYGACCPLAERAADLLEACGVSVELIDVQTLLPFDREGRIVESLKKTNRIVFVDEDVPGGATGFMMRQVLEEQGGYAWLDGMPRTVTGQEHRPAYGSDGDYFSKSNREQIFETVYDLMRESDPARFPAL